MYISFATPVECSDGPCGRCMWFLVDLASRRLTHIVVEENESDHILYLVPFEQVAGTSIQLIQLRCSMQELRAMPDLSKPRLVPTGNRGNTLDMASLVYRPYKTATPRRTPGSMVAVTDDMSVEIDNKHLGRLVGLEVSGRDGRIRYLTIERDQTRDPREVTCPAQEIETIAADSIYLKNERI